jgi:hypothetical protein
MNKCTSKKSWQEAKDKSIQKLKEQRKVRELEYNRAPKICGYCAKTLEYKDRHKQFCNSSCAASFNNKGVTRHSKNKNISKICILCEGEIINHSRNIKYCSSKCAGIHKTNIEIEKWKRNYSNILVLPKGIRNYIVRINDGRCCICGWGEKNPYSGSYAVVVDHIDGNSTNNSPDNLRVICPNCDSLTKTYMALNRGNGRASRRLQYARDKKKFE